MKHAYLIMAHTQIVQLKKLIHFLDHDENDIYVHIDKKCKETFFYTTQNAKLVLVDNPSSVKWGGYSQIELELRLLKLAMTQAKYDYYHLLSGQCMPIKTHTEISGFFEKYNGYEFIGFQNTDYSAELRNKIGTYHIFQNIVGNSKKPLLRIFRLIDHVLVFLQIKVGIDRREKGVVYGKGGNWFSISERCAKYVVSKEGWIKKHFHMTSCGDEIFLQTVILNSNFANQLYNGKCPSLRYTDWTRGCPYIFRLDDFDELMSAPADALFARKFSPIVDNAIIDKLYDKTGEE